MLSQVQQTQSDHQLDYVMQGRECSPLSLAFSASLQTRRVADTCFSGQACLNFGLLKPAHVLIIYPHCSNVNMFLAVCSRPATAS